MKAPLHKKAHRAIVSAHAKHLTKAQHAAKHGRTLCEMITAAFTAIETHMHVFSVICIAWILIDVVCFVVKVEEV